MSSSDTSKKRQRPSWKDLPAFLDASASVSVTTFGARRLPEIKSLWQAQARQQSSTSPLQEYQSGGGKTSSRHLRRRTTSHQSRKRHRYPQGTQQTSDNKNAKKPSRRARRKPAWLRQQHETWQQSMSHVASPPSSSVHWLTTHLWHAKRFHMHPNLFGWNIPLLHANRGARSAHRLVAEHHTLLQDVTWRMQPILIGSCDLNTLMSSLVCICPTFLQTENNPNAAVLSGSCFGEGMLHEPNQFPVGAIGPAMWWMCRRPLDYLSVTTAIKDESTWWVHIFVNAAIRTVVHDTLTSLAKKHAPLLEGPRDLVGGLSCFQLRGRNATSTITRALGPVTSSTDTEYATNCECIWDKMSIVDTLHTQLPHLTAVSVQVSLEGTTLDDPYASGSRKTPNDDCESFLEAYKASIQQWDAAAENSGRSPRIGERHVIIISHCRGDPSISQNAGVCGWDILCHPSDANDMFHALIENGKACTIGLVEEAHVRMESEPPLPVFPRDYPDTKSSQSYWDSDDVERSDWRLLRKCLEHGWGHVPVVQLGRQQDTNRSSTVSKPSWNRITTLPENAEFGTSTATGPVVVRGEFGIPFLDALAGCGNIMSSNNAARETGVRKRKRPRRRVRPPSTSVPMHMLSNDEADVHHDGCETLLRSLSLPALIFCHVKVEGKGTITACGHIYASMDDTEAETGYFDFFVGETVAGSFSPSRGCVHGVGFLGAARLLHVLGSHHGRLSCVAVTQPSNGARRAELKVTLKTSSAESGGRDATLSLLL